MNRDHLSYAPSPSLSLSMFRIRQALLNLDLSAARIASDTGLNPKTIIRFLDATEGDGYIPTSRTIDVLAVYVGGRVEFVPPKF